MRWIAPGRATFALGLAGLGTQNLILTDFLFELQPVPDWVPGRELWATITGILLVVASAGIIANERTRLAASALGVALFMWVLLLHVPRLVIEPGDGGAWGAAFQILALGGAAWILAAIPAADRVTHERRDSFIDKMAAPGRLCFGVSVLAFGVLHFIYHDFVASLIPAWIPGRPLWPYVTGAANVAAGMSILTGVKGRLGAALLGIMYGTWVLILHVPRIAADLDNRQEWTGMLMAMALCGGAWLAAGSDPYCSRRLFTAASSRSRTTVV